MHELHLCFSDSLQIQSFTKPLVTHTTTTVYSTALNGAIMTGLTDTFHQCAYSTKRLTEDTISRSWKR